MPSGLRLVEALLRGRGYDVARYPAGHPLLAGAWAALFPDAEVAACEAGLSLQRQAFALAHELGHLILHEHVPGGGLDATGSPADADRCGAAEIEVEADPHDALAGHVAVYNPRQQRELEANVFALNLLLPRPLLRRLFVKEGLDARAIAARCEVSLSATLQALAGLLDAPDAWETAQNTGVAGESDPRLPATPRLDDSQRAAVAAPGRAVLVQAGPGTGKTGTLVERVRYLLDERRSDPRQLAVLTFSNRAVDELQERLSSALGPRAQTLHISTIHGFCLELLRRYSERAGLPADFRVLDRPDLLNVLRRALAVEAPAELTAWLSLDRPNAALAELLDTVGRLKDDLIDAEEFARRVATSQAETADPPADALTGAASGKPREAQEAAAERGVRQVAFYRWYEHILSTFGVVDYGDLVMRAVVLLQEDLEVQTEVRAQYREVLLDEYQDLNGAAAALILALTGHADGATLWAVGDPRQSIYRWRGATPDALRLAPQEAGHDVDLPVLRVNYRSVGPIVRLCGAAAAAIDGASVVEGRAYWSSARGEPVAGDVESAPPITLAVAADGDAELRGVVDEIARGIARGRTPEDHAVLCATNAQADAVAAAIRAAGLPVCRFGEAADDPQVRRALAVLALAGGDDMALLRLTGDATSGLGTGPAERRWDVHPESAMELLRTAHERGERVLRTLTRPPETLSAEQRAAARALGLFLWRLPVRRYAGGSGAQPTWRSLARYLFEAPSPAARPLLAAVAARTGADAGEGVPADHPSERALHAVPTGYPALAALLACARSYDRQAPEFRASSLPAQVRLLLEAGEGLSLNRIEGVAGPGVRVLTVHAGKGLEFGVVFVPNLAKGRFPGRGRSGPGLVSGVLPGDEATLRAADDRCLFFVALSRARDRLILSRAERYSGRAAAPSPLLALLDEAFAAEPPALAQWPAAATGAAPSASVGRALGQRGAAGDEGIDARGGGELDVSMQDLETYLECPRRFYYATHLSPFAQTIAEPFPHYHRVLRRTLARLHAGMQEGGDQGAARVLEEEWAVEHAPHPYEQLYLERARQAVRTAQQTLVQPADEVAHDLEHRLVRPAGAVRVTIDRLERGPEGRPVATRYRTGRPSQEHHRDHRAALYQAALDAGYGGGTVQQEYVVAGTVDRTAPRGQTVATRLQECDDALEGIARGDYTPRFGAHCPGCPFWLICPAGDAG